MKKFTSFTLAFAMVVNMLAVCVFAANDSPEINHGFYGEIYVDTAGNEIETEIKETDNQYIVKVYVNDILDSTTISDKTTWEATEITYEEEEPIATTYDLHDYLEIVYEETSGEMPLGEIENTSSTSYSIINRYRTDYLYKGDILYADTKTAAYEPSIQNRHQETILNFTAGDGVGLVISVLCNAFTFTGFTVGTLIGLGLPVLGTKVADSFTRKVWKTDFVVKTKVYFEGIYTGLISQTYTDVMVSEITKPNNERETYYVDDLYGYDIVWGQSSYAASGCAVAFSDKYITGHNPNLKLPITRLPYYG